MKTTDKLDYAHQPEIDLPVDAGDGPFISELSGENGPAAQMASVDSVFRRGQPFRENWLTDLPVIGKSNLISIGYFRVSDKIGPNSFRRVFQNFRNEQSERLSGPIVIMFRGGGTAIIEEGLATVVPEPKTIEVPRPSYPIRKNARGRSQATSQGGKSLKDAMERLDQFQAWATPTLPAQTSFFYINFRLPGYEPNSGITLSPGDVMCFDPQTGKAKGISSANQTDEFLMGNSTQDAMAYRVDYAVGRSIPIIFDVINRNPTHSVVIDINVSIMIDRGETKNP